MPHIASHQIRLPRRKLTRRFLRPVKCVLFRKFLTPVSNILQFELLIFQSYLRHFLFYTTVLSIWDGHYVSTKHDISGMGLRALTKCSGSGLLYQPFTTKADETHLALITL